MTINIRLKNKLYIVLFTFVILVFSSLQQAHAIPVDLSGATLVTGPYPYTVNDSLGLIGTSSDGLGNPNDVDYYKFWANSGDLLTADIDNGFDGRDGGFITPGEDIDVLLSLFYNNVAGFVPYSTFGSNCMGLPNADDAGCAIDPGSYLTNPLSIIAYTKDPYISYSVPLSGYYYLAVSISDNHIASGAFSGVSTLEFPEGGTYTLTIDGLSAAPVPEPSTLILLAVGMILIVLFRIKLPISGLTKP